MRCTSSKNVHEYEESSAEVVVLDSILSVYSELAPRVISPKLGLAGSKVVFSIAKGEQLCSNIGRLVSTCKTCFCTARPHKITKAQISHRHNGQNCGAEANVCIANGEATSYNDARYITDQKSEAKRSTGLVTHLAALHAGVKDLFLS